MALILPFVIFAVGIVAYPLAYSAWLSFHKVNFSAPPGKQYAFVGVAQYAKVLGDPLFLSSLWISVQLLAQTVFISTLLGLVFALLLNERFKGRWVMRAIVLIPWAAAEWISGVMFRYVYDIRFGTLNGILYTVGVLPEYIQWVTYESAVTMLSLAYAWHLIPLGAFFMLAALQTVPEDLLKAGKIDGAGAFLRFRVVVLPFIRYALLITAVINTLLAATSLDLLFLLTTGGPGKSTYTLTYYVYDVTMTRLDIGYGAAASFLLIAVIMLITAVYFVGLRAWELWRR